MSDDALTQMQRDVLDLFFSLPEADGFVLAGGAALIASGLSERPTHIRSSPTFRRIFIRSSSSELLVDLAVDSPPRGAQAITAVGPTYPPEELGARKLLALFDRAAARDFVDVHALAATFDLGDLLDIAADLDDGFDLDVFIEMLATLDRYDDTDISDLGAEPAQLRGFVTRWRDQLRASSGS
jgi:hypothetical protein